MAELCGGDSAQLNALWQRAEDERQARLVADQTVNGETPRPRMSYEDGETTTPAAQTVLPGGLRTVRPQRSRAFVVGAVLLCTVAAGAAGLFTGLSLRKTPAAPAHPYTQWLTRDEIIARVRTWHPHTSQRIPYSQGRFYQGYRTDGSGYASMAIGLPAPGPNSPDLASGQYTRRITPAELMPGDLIINAAGDSGTRQVAIFDSWVNSAHTRYWVYQQRRGYGTDHLVLSYPLDPPSAYGTYRPLNVHELSAPRTAVTGP